MHNKWYWTFKHVLLGPILRLYNRPEIEGVDKIPSSGAVILASNHQSVMDSFYFPLVYRRQITFPAKSEYFTSSGCVGRLQKVVFTSVGQVPIDRNSPTAAAELISTAREILGRGDVFGIYPEGTRSPDGRVYKGRTGMARIAFTTNDPVVPVAMIGSREANPIGSWIPRPYKVRMKIGDPIIPSEFAEDRGLNTESHEAYRALTDYVMHELSRLSGQPYVDIYATEVKKSLEEGKGYPEGAQ
ncbi:1-acyl-sn-glycerol-3-phosphate acyltransferase [Corynebacterium pseudotuberculosis]|uniref:lysophospholipid acyltransferase family protein n=1 Tax=Corynebacterium pseudotuberculosis TaxID=1719 RepID=UPI000C1CC22D|nr:lysophospholipid acyltransferase family protein [Corynebacterium pseudotuberculosis]ATV80313.1 1-acyl-sn-glycerol-3-phosphate acyltransferase [Corynebacterium pseudotuberculosis]